MNFCGTGSIHENREHLYPRNIPAIRYVQLCNGMKGISILSCVTCRLFGDIDAILANLILHTHKQDRETGYGGVLSR